MIANEYQECKAYWNWAQGNDLLKEYLIKNANENQSKNWFRWALIAIGMRPGLPDYHLPFANNKYHGLWIEMKTKDQVNKKKRENQEEWIAKLTKINHYACYAYGCDDAVRITQDYLQNKL